MTVPFVAKRDEEIPGPWQLLAGGERTGKLVEFGDARVPPKTAGPGLHVHTHEDEAQYIVSGVMSFLVGGRRFQAGAGELVWLPREVPHAFANFGDEPVWSIGIVIPAGLERMFQEEGAYLSSLRGPPDPERIRQITAPYGVRMLGPPLTPVSPRGI